MKKVFGLIVLVGLLFLVSGCGEKNVEGTLEEIMTKVYAKVPDENKPMGLSNIEIDKDSIKDFVGTDEFEFEEALASESMVGSIAHSVVLIRTKDAKSVEEIKNQIKENVNPRKWICVGVEKEDVIIQSKGNLIIVIIVEDKDARTKLEEGFNKL